MAYKKRFLTFFFFVLLISSLPYVVALLSQTQGYIFAGFVFNPLDSNSYLAKMYEGWSGSWLFTLPFTSDPGAGQPLFLYYLLLGHISRVLNIPLLWMFQIARVVGGFLMYLAIWKFCIFIYEDNLDIAWKSFVLVGLGSGLGWMLAFSGYFLPDLWVAEAYPFLSFYANPHFPLGLSILVWMILLVQNKDSRPNYILVFFLGIALAIVMPFGVVVLFTVLTVHIGWKWLSTRNVDLLPYLWANLGGVLFLLYEYSITLTHVQLAQWNSQNKTTSPPIYEVFLSLAPAIILSLWGLRKWRMIRKMPPKQLVWGWFIGALVLMYIPFNLQRRFMLGLFIPVAILAIFAIYEYLATGNKKYRFIWPGLLGLSVLTNIFILLACCLGALAHDPMLFMYAGEVDAFNWIQTHTTPSSVILASPQTSMFLPGRTGRRVVYGHPYETINAEVEKRSVEALFSGPTDEMLFRNYITDHSVGYIFYGVREKVMRGSSTQAEFVLPYPIVYQNKTVTIWQVPKYEE